MKLLPSAYTLNVETLQMEKKFCEWGKMSFFASINFGHNSWTKASMLKCIKYFRGRKENSKSTDKKAKSKTKGFFSRKWGFSQNKIVHSLSKISIPDPLFLLHENKFTLTLFPFLWHHPPPLTHIKLNNLTWNMGVVLH